MISALTIEDADQLYALDVECFSVPWSKKELEDEIKHQNGIILGSFSGKHLIGALLARIIIDEIWVFRIMVLPKDRMQNIAQELFHKLIDPLEKTAEQLVNSIWIEVAKSNKGAIGFYEKQGFLRVSSRFGYYSANHLRSEPEDAWVMCRRLNR